MTAYGYGISERNLGFFLKALLFLILSIVLYKFNLNPEIQTYRTAGTTFSTHYEVSEMIQVPNILICMQPGVKKSVTRKYGYKIIPFCPLPHPLIYRNYQNLDDQSQIFAKFPLFPMASLFPPIFLKISFLTNVNNIYFCHFLVSLKITKLASSLKLLVKNLLSHDSDNSIKSTILMPFWQY